MKSAYSKKTLFTLTVALLAPLAAHTVAAEDPSQALAETASNINHAFVAQERAAGNQKTSFPGPLGGTISVGYTLDPATPGKLSVADLIHTNAFNGRANAAGWYYLRVTVAPRQVKVEYVRSFLPKDETADTRQGCVAHTYDVKSKFA